MKDRAPPSGPDSARLARQKRLAEALRANLRRRKAAGRAGPAPSDDDDGRNGGDESTSGSEPESRA